MIQLHVSDTYATSDDLLLALEQIVGMIGEGYTSGYTPHWTITGEQEELTCAAEGDDSCTVLPGESECRSCGA
jgi:hypothetical protein